MMKDDIVELIGEDGEGVRFRHLMTLEYKAQYYLLLSPAEPADDAEAGDVVIMRITKDADGQDCYEIEEDDAVSQAVFDKFLDTLDEEDTWGDDASDEETDDDLPDDDGEDDPQ